ncbi:hypothetical protein [Paraburkholderia gardini]|uniref:hypothetical protein n=1 Tax=Paraburkholderia gardini TaxID=2823469 RepID=UPI001DD06FFB|nr:hypothetical protein [Paraburkholderia gardini]CAG4889458.1 hypothetical protein R69919_00748 [Paraburkholderia gardini]
MNARESVALDVSLLQINELIARITVSTAIEVRMQLGKELKAEIAAYLRDVTATACVGKGK